MAEPAARSTARITYVEANGTRHQVDVPVGASLMQGAIDHVIPGIEGDCGGLCACGTCHVYIDDGWRDRCSEQDELAAELDGLVVRMPVRQY